jgi:hypothetical protein
MGNTDSNGDFKFTFTAPQTTTLINLALTATAMKNGYSDGSNQIEIIVNPQEGGLDSLGGSGLSLTTLLIILVPVVVVAVVVVVILKKRRAMRPPSMPMGAPTPSPRPNPSPR